MSDSLIKIMLSSDDFGNNEKVDVIDGDVWDVVIVADDSEISVVDVNNVWDGSLMFDVDL